MRNIRKVMAIFLAAVILLVCVSCQEAHTNLNVGGSDKPADPDRAVEFVNENYITDSAVSITAGSLVYDIDDGVYVPDDLAEISVLMESAIEKVTGLDFDGNEMYSRDYYEDDMVHLLVTDDYMYRDLSWYEGLATNEFGSAYANAVDHVIMSPGDLFLGRSYTAIHELSHVIMYRQTEWSHCQLLDEGFASYTTYLGLLELEGTDPDSAIRLDTSLQAMADMEIYNYSKLFEQPVEHWFTETFEYSANANYTVGFRFMAYLDDVYGDYSKWITEFENMYPFTQRSSGSDMASKKMEIEVLKSAYGDDVLDGFYPWLKKHLGDFSFDLNAYLDLSDVQALELYPSFNSFETSTALYRFSYEDMYINIESARNYLSEYKNIDISALTLTTSSPAEVILYYEDGTSAEVTTDRPVSLEAVSHIKLVGFGMLDSIEITGYTV